MQTIPTTPVAAQPHPCNSPVTDSSCPWTGSTWDYDYGELWKAWTAAGRGGPGRVSCSSIESGSSFEDYVVSDVDDNNNESDRLSNNNNETSSVVDCPITNTPTGVKEDTNNNTVVTPTAEEEDVTNNNKPNTSEKDVPKEEYRSKNSVAGRTRLLDEDGFIRRAACVCVDETESKVLLVSSKKDPCSWLVPGGGVEDGEETPIAAIREAWEEAGVQGHITRYLGLFETQQQGGRKRHRTAVFVVLVKDVLAQYPEAHLGRRREWFSLEDGFAHLSRNRPLQSAYLELLLVSHLKPT